MSGVFNSVPPLFGTAQAFLLSLAQLEAQLVLNLISNVAAVNNRGYGNPLVAVNLLQPVGIQRSSFLSMYQHPCFKNMDAIPHMVSHPSTSLTETNSVIANNESGPLPAKEIIQEKTVGPIMNNTTLPLPSSKEALIRSSTNHPSKHFSLKPHVDCSQFQSMTAKAMTPPDKPQIEEAEPGKQTMLHFPTENLIKALSSVGLSLEDLEVLSHCPDNELTTEKLPFIIQDIQQRKGAKDIKYGHAQWNSSDQVENTEKNKTFIRKKIKFHPKEAATPLSTTYNVVTKGHQQSSFPDKSVKSEAITESINIQVPAKTSAQTKGVIRVSGISLDYSESELIKMASPFGHPVEVLMATEVDTATCLEWKKALLMFPTEFSAQEMVKVYSAIPVHMRQQSLELVSQTVDFSSPVSVFHAFVGPSLSNGLLTPLDHLLVVCNVPNQPNAAVGVLRLLKPFGQVFRTLVLLGNKVDVDQCLGNNSKQQKQGQKRSFPDRESNPGRGGESAES
ncbi:hypothetical protein QQF64_000876 [Cirrhinus molitorella]|uniref:Uncharacterized protein n=1 Tax=Cirrhinus molitorella TaxID=172907 RepID=A0ABR3NYF1_9TELE